MPGYKLAVEFVSSPTLDGCTCPGFSGCLASGPWSWHHPCILPHQTLPTTHYYHRNGWLPSSLMFQLLSTVRTSPTLVLSTGEGKMMFLPSATKWKSLVDTRPRHSSL